MPTRAETVRGYVQGMHAHWLGTKAREAGYGNALAGLASLETRFRYNPDVKSLVAMVPAMIPLLLMLIPAMLAALSVVREKELGSITNFYVTPTTRLEFLLGKQLPYVGVVNAELPAAHAAGSDRVRRPAEGQLSHALCRRAALCRCIHRRRPADIDVHAQPDRCPIRHCCAHHPAGRQLFRA